MIVAPRAQDFPINSSKSGRKASVKKYLTDCKSFYYCLYCRTHLANHDDLISRSFIGSQGRASLFETVINISCGPTLQRNLTTGSHDVADIYCSSCGKSIGWKYERAHVETQKYKEGKYILELAHVVRENRHLELDRRDMFLNIVHEKDRNYQRGSISPPNNSGSPWSSSTPTTASSSNDNVDLFNDADDEPLLMYPIYDDLDPDKSSYPSLSSFRLDHINRRSLYSDSTPYDWKYSTAGTRDSSSSFWSLGNQFIKSFDRNQRESSNSRDDETKLDKMDSSDDQPNTAYGDDSECQFKFESDGPDLGPGTSSDCLHSQAPSTSRGGGGGGGGANLNDSNSPSADGVDNSTIVITKASCSSSNANCRPFASLERPTDQLSLSLDDEEFYDCLTDHDVSNSIANSNHKSTRRI